jgi:hypothetical protein
LEFEIKENIINGDYIRNYYIGGKEVDQKTYDSMFEEQMAKTDKIKIKKVKNQINQNQINKPSDLIDREEYEYDGEDCECERCEFIRTVLDDIKSVDDEAGFRFLVDIFNQIEDGAMSEGLKQGYLSCLKNTTDMLNRSYYNIENLEFIVDEWDNE